MDPTAPTREARLTLTFVELINSLVVDFDVIDLLTVLTTRCVEVLGADAAGILLADGDGRLRVMAASTEQISLLELFQVQNDEGPCFDCYTTGTIVVVSDLSVGTSPWPGFAVESVSAGFPSVCAIPLRLNARILGCLNLFMSAPRGLTAGDVAVAQGLADVASIAIVQDEAARQAGLRALQLQHALDSRIVIEQAKGMIAQRHGADLDAAFGRLRQYARNNNKRLGDVAAALVVHRTLHLDDI